MIEVTTVSSLLMSYLSNFSTWQKKTIFFAKNTYTNIHMIIDVQDLLIIEYEYNEYMTKITSELLNVIMLK